MACDFPRVVSVELLRQFLQQFEKPIDQTIDPPPLLDRPSHMPFESRPGLSIHHRSQFVECFRRSNGGFPNLF
jgi:hypothetical protein